MSSHPTPMSGTMLIKSKAYRPSNMLFVIQKATLLLMIATLLSSCVSSSPAIKARNTREDVSDNALIHAQLARGYLKQKQYSVAKSELDRALKIDGNHSISNYVMALLMIELKQYDEANRHFARAVRSDSSNSSAAHDYGVFLCQTSREAESVKYFEMAAENPLFARPELSYMRAGECLSQIKDPAAEAYLKRALEKNPRLRPALYRLAHHKYAAQSYFSARAYIERYFAITNPQPEALLLAYRIESKLNATEKAAEYRKQLLENFQGSDQAHLLRSQSRN